MKTSLLLALLCATFSLSSQNETLQHTHSRQMDHVHCQPERFMTWGEYYYPQNLEGIGSLVKDLSIYEPELHALMNPAYQGLKKRHTESQVILFAGNGLGLALITAALVPKMSTTNYNYPGRDINNDAQRSIGLLVAGALTCAVSSVLFSTRAVHQNDVLEFSNKFNRHSAEEKLRLRLQPSFGFDQVPSGGIGLCLDF